MKIVHVVRQFHPSIGGMEDVVCNLVRELAKHPEFTVSVVTLDRLFRAPAQRLPAREMVGDVPVVRLPWRGSSRYPVSFGLLEAIRDADIVHVHAIDFAFDYLALTRGLHGKPLVASTHGGFFHTAFASRLKKIWFHSITRGSALGYRRIFASSASDAAQFDAIAPNRTVMIENGVDIDKWREAGSRQPSRTLISIGRFSINKDIPALLRVVKALADREAGWRLILAGTLSDLSVADVERDIRDLGLEGVVDLRVGPDPEALRRAIGQCGYLISASRYEGFGLTAVEGLSAGLHPLLNDIAAFRALVEQTGTGDLLDMATPQSAADTIDARHRARERAWMAGFAANVAASDRHSWTHVASLFADAYHEIRRSSRARRAYPYFARHRRA